MSGDERGSKRALAGAAVALLVLLAPIALGQNRSGPRSAAGQALARAEELFQEGIRLRTVHEVERSNATLAEAESGFRRVIQLDQDNVTALTHLSSILLTQRRSRAALEMLQAARTRQPQQLALMQEFGVHLMALGRGAEARPLLEQVLRANPRLHDAQLILARYCYSKRDFPAAIEHFRGYLQSRPGSMASTDADVHGSIGNAYLALRNYGRARAEYAWVLRLSERNLPARINTAYSFYEEGNYQEAVTRYEALLRLGDPQPLVLANLARSLWKLGRIPRAIDRSHQLQRLRPRSHLGYLVEAEILISRRNVRDAVPKIRAALSRAPRDVATLLVAVTAFQATGDLRSAQQHLETARRIDPDNLDVVSSLASLFLRTQREREALPLFARVTAARPRDAEAWFGLGACQYALGVNDAAIEAFETALRQRADLVAAKQGLAATHNRTAVDLAVHGDLAGAKAAFERAISAEPTGKRAHRNLGEILLQEGATAEALPHLERGIDGATDRDGNFLLGRALLASGRAPDAVSKLQASLQATGSTPDQDVGLALGVALSLSGTHDQAIDQLRRALGNESPPERLRFLSIALLRRALVRSAAGQTAGALQDLHDAEQNGRGLSREERERLSFVTGLVHLSDGDGRKATAKLQPLARSSAPYLAAPYNATGIAFFLMYARYLSNDYRAFFTALRTVRTRAPAELNAMLNALEINAHVRNAEALFSRGSIGPARTEIASIRRLGGDDDGLVRLADACLEYASGHREAAGAKFGELARRVRAGSDAEIPREALLNLGIFRDDRHDNAGAVEAYTQYIAAGGRHSEVARRLIERKRRVLGIGGPGGAP